MKYFLPTLYIILLPFLTTGCQQHRSQPPPDLPKRSALTAGKAHIDSNLQRIFQRTITDFRKEQEERLHFGDTLVGISRLFLGAPYEAGTLDKGMREQLVLNLSSFDCTTLVEQVLALGLALRQDSILPEVWASEVEQLRYRKGRCEGYGSRLHYFSEWLTLAAANGTLDYPPDGIKAVPIERTLDFMSHHRSAYPRLRQDSVFANILRSEQQLRNHLLYQLPKNEIKAHEALMRQGDIVAFVTSIDGLDVTHTGFVYKDSGTTRLLHASTSGKVSISEVPLHQYAARLNNCTGILLARPR